MALADITDFNYLTDVAVLADITGIMFITEITNLTDITDITDIELGDISRARGSSHDCTDCRRSDPEAWTAQRLTQISQRDVDGIRRRIHITPGAVYIYPAGPAGRTKREN